VEAFGASNESNNRNKRASSMARRLQRSAKSKEMTMGWRQHMYQMVLLGLFVAFLVTLR